MKPPYQERREAALVAAVQTEADVIIAGRTTGAALFLAPLVQAFGWASDDWDRLACGTVVGHLLECAGQLSGGYFADGVRKHVPNLAQLGFPHADVCADGAAGVSRLPEAGAWIARHAWNSCCTRSRIRRGI